MNSEGKSREQIKTEREAKKAAKAAAKSKGSKNVSQETIENITEKVRQINNNLIPSIATETIKINSVVQPELIVEKLTNVLSQTTIMENNKSKAELKAERRAKQEAQRAVKQGQVQLNKEKPKQGKQLAKFPINPQKAPESPQKSEDSSNKKILTSKIIAVKNSHEISLFKHLYHEREQSFLKLPAVNTSIHPAIVRLGSQYASKVIVGSNARCIALLAAVKQLIEDFERPSQADFTRGLETSLQEASTYLHHCRPLAVSMQNALRHIKRQMTQLKNTVSDEVVK